MELLESLGSMLHHLWREGGPDQEEGTGEWSSLLREWYVLKIWKGDQYSRRSGDTRSINYRRQKKCMKKRDSFVFAKD